MESKMTSETKGFIMACYRPGYKKALKPLKPNFSFKKKKKKVPQTYFEKLCSTYRYIGKDLNKPDKECLKTLNELKFRLINAHLPKKQDRLQAGMMIVRLNKLIVRREKNLVNNA